ncbi:MAG: CHAT domain-containing protein [Thermoanaerobaculia bacterium]
MSIRPAMALLALFGPALVPHRALAAAPDLAACESLFAANPGAEEPAKCFYTAGQRPELHERALRRLAEIRSRWPDLPWIAYYMGWSETPARAETLFRAAAERFQAQGDARGEILARDSRERILMLLGRPKEADREMARVVQVAEASGDPVLRLRGQLVEARHLLAQGRDLEHAYLVSRRAEAAAFPDAPYSVRRDSLLLLGNVSLATGRVREAREAYRRLARLAREEGDRFAEATASYSLARSLTDELAELPRDEERAEALATARQALDAATASGHIGVETKAHLIIGMLSAGPEAERHVARCVETSNVPAEKSYCLGLQARRESATRPEHAAALVEQAFTLARETGDPASLAAAWRERMRLSWRTAPPERAAADSWSTLRTLEALYELQSGPAASPELFSSQSEDYYWLSGRLLRGAAEGGGAGLLDRAFDVTERMRARALMAELTAARAAPVERGEALRLKQRRAATLGEIAGVQRRLLDPGLPGPERTAARRGLERLELEEAGLRYQLARANPAAAALLRPDFVSLAGARRALAPDEALLSFQVAPWKDMTGGFGGGSWLVAATRDGARAYRILDRVALRPAVALFDGLFPGRSGAEAGASVRLYEALLGPALRDLPKGVRRLVIVPDDALHKLPFGALRQSPGAPPLALRYEVSLVPSATLWLRWTRSRPAPAEVPALAFADPPMPGGGRRPASGPVAERSAVFTDPSRLAPLPFSRDEGRSVIRMLDHGSRLLLGEEASERFLKANDLNRFSILHFATHAVTDDVVPERSGVLLSPGGADQDGLLQIREIGDLKLGGRVVVLSACSSNTGAVLRGEGVMSLARAFFQAGAHTVVASLWRLRDDEAAELFGRFYRHLSQGRSVSAALQAAQRDLIEDGAPAAAWAGVVVLGDGGLVPLPGGRGWTLSRVLQLAAAIFLTLAVLTALRALRR